MKLGLLSSSFKKIKNTYKRNISPTSILLSKLLARNALQKHVFLINSKILCKKMSELIFFLSNQESIRIEEPEIEVSAANIWKQKQVGE